MSFSQKVKSEILKAGRDVDALFCMLCGEILSAGSLTLSRQGISFTLNSENKEFLETVAKQLDKCFQVSANKIEISAVSGTLKSKFELTVEAKTGSMILEGLGILSKNKEGELVVNRTVDPNLITDDEGKKSYLAGAFCGAGSVSTPAFESEQAKPSSGYHMEWVCLTAERADTICEYLAELGIISKKIERNGNFVVYLKESDAICQALALLGAVASMLELENSKVERSVRNNINRASNCLSANLDKVVSASVKQMQAIDVIEGTVGLNSLSLPLQQVAVARRDNPQASLSELAEILGGNISRVAVRERLMKLIKIAQSLGEENG